MECICIRFSLLDFRINVNDLEVLSSTDRKCMWKNKHKDSLSKYQPLPLEQHACFGKIEKNIVTIFVTEDLNTIITKLLTDRIPKSAFAKHMQLSLFFILIHFRACHFAKLLLFRN